MNFFLVQLKLEIMIATKGKQTHQVLQTTGEYEQSSAKSVVEKKAENKIFAAEIMVSPKICTSDAGLFLFVGIN